MLIIACRSESTVRSFLYKYPPKTSWFQRVVSKSPRNVSQTCISGDWLISRIYFYQEFDSTQLLKPSKCHPALAFREGVGAQGRLLLEFNMWHADTWINDYFIPRDLQANARADRSFPPHLSLSLLSSFLPLVPPSPIPLLHPSTWERWIIEQCTRLNVTPGGKRCAVVQ